MCEHTPEQNCLHSERPGCTKHDKVRLRTSTAADFTRALCFAVHNSFAFRFRFCSGKRRQTRTLFDQTVHPTLHFLKWITEM